MCSRRHCGSCDQFAVFTVFNMITSVGFTSVGSVKRIKLNEAASPRVTKEMHTDISSIS